MAKAPPKSKFVKDVGKALVRAAADARVIACRYGTPIYIWENGKWSRRIPEWVCVGSPMADLFWEYGAAALSADGYTKRRFSMHVKRTCIGNAVFLYTSGGVGP